MFYAAPTPNKLDSGWGMLEILVPFIEITGARVKQETTGTLTKQLISTVVLACTISAFAVSTPAFTLTSIGYLTLL